MYENAYDIVALGMRYLFVAMIVYILVRTARSVYREYIYERSAQRGLRAAAWGIVEIIAPAQAPFLGEQYLLKRENTIGRAKRCDIYLPFESLASVHASLFQRKAYIYVCDYGAKGGVKVNGERIKRERKLEDGDVISMGCAVLKLYLSRGEADDVR